jgi:prepilin-type processing-associated H-X9-DG protein
MPYIEQDSAFENSEFSNQTWWWGAGLGNNADERNSKVYQNVYFNFMYCPSSPLPRTTMDPNSAPGFGTNLSGVWLADPMYVCILGSDRHRSCDTSGTNGPVSDGGVIVLSNRPHVDLPTSPPAGQTYKDGRVRVNDILDGTAFTMMVGEQSDWGNEPINGPKRDIRSSDRRGFAMGTSHVVKPNGPGSMGAPVNQGGCGIPNCQRCYNTTTIRLAINAQKRLWQFACMGDQRCCRPIQSVHPGGAQVLKADGHVVFLKQTISIDILKNLADRDDGRAIPNL